MPSEKFFFSDSGLSKHASVSEAEPEQRKRRTKKAIQARFYTDPKFKLTLRLLYGDEIAFGPGKAELLEAIESTGSISAAGRMMDMSYRRAWLLVDAMNRSFREPVVDAARGGKHGGGAHLTPFGKEVLARYREAYGALQQVANTYLRLFQPCMAETPPSGEPPEPSASDPAA